MSSFRGASADAVASLEASALWSTLTGSAASVGDDLFVVAATLLREGALRRFLTDASVPAQGRSGLVREIFGATVGGPTADLLADVVERRWTRAGDLPVALEHFAVLAVVTSVGDQAGRLSDELFAVAQTVKEHPELREALSDPARSVADRSALVETLLGAKALPATTTLVKQSLLGTHRTVDGALEEYQQVAAQSHGAGVATVRVAHELSQADQERLAAALQQQYGRPIHLNLLVDPDVLGGIKVEIGDDVIDGTVASRLADARRRLAG